MIAWKISRCLIPIYHSKVRGTTYENRQSILRHLLKYDFSDITLDFHPDTNNSYNGNSIKISAHVRGNGILTIGYLSKELAVIISKGLKEGRQVIAFFNCITGAHRKGGILGCNFSFVLL